jgi:hypothetical protein
MRRPLLVLAAVAVLLAGIGIYALITRYPHKIPLPIPLARDCGVRTVDGEVRLTAEQMANAATIAAVGVSRNVPDQGIVVALATAMQESDLINVNGGDRDSVGLFQQRPSQGWGTAEQVHDPRYASAAFYRQLLRTRGWQDMTVTQAAQAVQRSAYPEAYAKHETKARILGTALVGAAASAVTCGPVDEPPLRGAAAREAVSVGLRADWGEQLSSTLATGQDGVTVTANQERTGWQFAHWLVAQSAVHGVAAVSFGNHRWTADSGTWTTVAAGEHPTRVVAEVYP